ncbi:MAG: MFS transporter [candidate division Zixibacteria bacterium]|nr:MFS transporter [candidate division Zixibacteria bacterium]
MHNNRFLNRNLALGIINGIFFNLSLAFLSGTTILPLFISGLTDSRVIIGFFSTLQGFGWYLPQLFMGAYIAGRPLVLGYYNKISFLRIVLFASCLVLIFTIKNSNHSLLLIGFGLIIGLYAIASGMAGISFMEIVGKMIPTNKRGTLFGSRMFFGGLLAVLAGPVIKVMLDRWDFPLNFGYMYCISMVAIIMGLSSFAFVRELPSSSSITKPGFSRNLRKSLGLLKGDSNIRRLIISRYLTNAALLAIPFYIIMATDNLGISRPMAATYLSFERIGFLGLNILWAWLSNRISNKVVLKASTISAIIAPALALFSIYHNPGYFVYGLVFFFNGAALSGTNMGYINYLLEIANDDNRAMAMGLVHTLIAPTIFLSVLGGIIIEIFNLKVLFIVTLVCLIISYFYLTHLNEPVRSTGSEK